MAHALPYTSFTTSDVSLDQNDLLAPPAIRASIAAAPVPSFTVTHPYQVRGRRPRDAFEIYLDVFFAMHKVRLLARRKSEVNQLASGTWRELSEEGKLMYETMARLEREVYERDILTQHRGSSAGSNSSRSNGWRSRAPSRSAADLPYAPLTLGIDAQASIYRAPAIVPTATPEVLRIQYPASFAMNADGIVMLQGVHVPTQGQGNQQVHATQGMQAPYQPLASISVPTAVAESSDPQIHNPIPYYHDTSSQSFNAVMNQAAAITQYLPSAPVAAPVARRPNPVNVSFSHHQLDGNTYVHNGWGDPSTSHTSALSFVEGRSSNHGVGLNRGGELTHGGGSSTYYNHLAEDTWNDSYRQYQLWSSDYSGRRS